MKRKKMLLIAVIATTALLMVNSRTAYADKSVERLAHALEKLAGYDFIELFGEAIGRNHLWLLDKDRNIYRVDVLAAPAAPSVAEQIVYFFWNGGRIESLLSDSTALGVTYKELFDKEKFEAFATDIKLFLTRASPAVFQSPWTSYSLALSGVDVLNTARYHENVPNREVVKKYKFIENFDPLISDSSELTSSADSVNMRVKDVFGGGLSGVYTYLFATKAEKAALLYVYRHANRLYGFFVEGLGGTDSWDDGQTAGIAQRIMDDWRTFAKKYNVH